MKDGVAALRAELSNDDQTLLVLRIDKGLTFGELGRVLHDGDPHGFDEKREAARLRQRFQTLKRRLLEEARARGLVKSS